MFYCIEKGDDQHLINELLVEKLYLTIARPEMFSFSLFLCSKIFFTFNRNIVE